MIAAQAAPLAAFLTVVGLLVILAALQTRRWNRTLRDRDSLPGEGIASEPRLGAPTGSAKGSLISPAAPSPGENVIHLRPRLRVLEEPLDADLPFDWPAQPRGPREPAA